MSMSDCGCKIQALDSALRHHAGTTAGPGIVVETAEIFLKFLGVENDPSDEPKEKEA